MTLEGSDFASDKPKDFMTLNLLEKRKKILKQRKICQNESPMWLTASPTRDAPAIRSVEKYGRIFSIAKAMGSC
jgi:hypothetical protein